MKGLVAQEESEGGTGLLPGITRLGLDARIWPYSQNFAVQTFLFDRQEKVISNFSTGNSSNLNISFIFSLLGRHLVFWSSLSLVASGPYGHRNVPISVVKGEWTSKGKSRDVE